MADEQIAEMLAENGYLGARRLPDGSVAVLIPLMFTLAVGLGATPSSSFTTRRFCFEDPQQALNEFNRVTSKDQILEGWIASRGLEIPENGYGPEDD